MDLYSDSKKSQFSAFGSDKFKGKGGRRPKNHDQLNGVEDDKLKQRRLRNKEAAARCRQKRLERMNTLQIEVDQLKAEKCDLERELKRMEDDKTVLEQVFLSHSCRLPDSERLGVPSPAKTNSSPTPVAKVPTSTSRGNPASVTVGPLKIDVSSLHGLHSHLIRLVPPKSPSFAGVMGSSEVPHVPQRPTLVSPKAVAATDARLISTSGVKPQPGPLISSDSALATPGEDSNSSSSLSRPNFLALPAMSNPFATTLLDGTTPSVGFLNPISLSSLFKSSGSGITPLPGAFSPVLASSANSLVSSTSTSSGTLETPTITMIHALGMAGLGQTGLPAHASLASAAVKTELETPTEPATESVGTSTEPLADIPPVKAAKFDKKGANECFR